MRLPKSCKSLVTNVGTKSAKQAVKTRLAGQPHATMKTKFIPMLLGAAALSFAVTSCKSNEEESRENALENKADALENNAKEVRKVGEVVSDMKKDDAKATEKAAEQKADELENAADKTREAK